MTNIAQGIYLIFPLLALLSWIIGRMRKSMLFVSAGLWLALIALLIHYEYSGAEIHGGHFTYLNAAVYTFNILILILCSFSLLYSRTPTGFFGKLFNSLAKTVILLGGLILLVTVWMNAWFIEQRMDGTPVMQIMTFDAPDYCEHEYAFYIITKKGELAYLCPLHYFFMPAIGTLDTVPASLKEHIPAPILEKVSQSVEEKN